MNITVNGAAQASPPFPFYIISFFYCINANNARFRVNQTIHAKMRLCLIWIVKHEVVQVKMNLGFICI